MELLHTELWMGVLVHLKSALDLICSNLLYVFGYIGINYPLIYLIWCRCFENWNDFVESELPPFIGPK